MDLIDGKPPRWHSPGVGFCITQPSYFRFGGIFDGAGLGVNDFFTFKMFNCGEFISCPDPLRRWSGS